MDCGAFHPQSRRAAQCGTLVKARALAVYLTVFFGSMTAGSALWGQIASQFGTPTSLVVATLGMVLASATVFRWKLEKDPDLNLDLSGQPLDGVEIDLPNERGPVLVSHEYIIDPHNAKAFCRRCTSCAGYAAAPGDELGGIRGYRAPRTVYRDLPDGLTD